MANIRSSHFQHQSDVMNALMHTVIYILPPWISLDGDLEKVRFNMLLNSVGFCIQANSGTCFIRPDICVKRYIRLSNIVL